MIGYDDVDRLESVAGALDSYAGLVGSKRGAARWKAEAQELRELALRLENMRLKSVRGVG